ncbi:MAG: single-stranded-DNA-specific exonuclease RecJ [Thermoanaerobaculia bacterium]
MAPRLAALLAQRGVRDIEAARDFLTPRLDQLHPATGLAGIADAVARLVRARETGEAVAIVGDYDVDGVAATALLLGVLRHLGISAQPILPSRHDEGYGFQPLHVERARELGARLLVTVDCGVTAFEAIAAARAAGIDVVVTDHHLPGERLPPGAIVVNPRQGSCTYPFRDLSGAGLALKLATALYAAHDREVPWESLLRMACLGTIADVAPLVGENRVLARFGLAALARSPSPGMRELFRRTAIAGEPTASDVAFRLGPRLNAAGRLARADAALELLLTRDPRRAAELGEELENLNRARQELESRVLAEARAEFAGQGESRLLVAWSGDWHRGVVGIAAGRLARELHRPVILLGVEGELAVGSGRSVPGVELHELIAPWRERLVRFGGHAQAVGLTARTGDLDDLRLAWTERAAREIPESDFAAELRFDLALAPNEIDDRLAAMVAQLEPCGQGNPEPVFRLGPLTAEAPPRQFGRGHLEVRVAGTAAGRCRLIAWRFLDDPGVFARPFEALARFAGASRRGDLELHLVDVRPVADGGAA